MVRKFIDFDGYVLGEEKWMLNSNHTCFYCDQPLVLVKDKPCPFGLAALHDFVTLCER